MTKQTKQVGSRLLWQLWEDRDSFDWSRYLQNPFEMPALQEWDIQPAESEEDDSLPFCFRRQGRICRPMEIAKGAVSTIALSSDWFGSRMRQQVFVTVEDPAAKQIGGYWLTSCCPTFVFDRLLWEANGKPLDGRSLRLTQETLDGMELLPFVFDHGSLLIVEPDNRTQESDAFPIQKLAGLMPQHYGTVCQREYVPYLHMVLADSLKDAGLQDCDLAFVQDLLRQMKEQKQQDAHAAGLSFLKSEAGISFWGYLDKTGDLSFCVHIPGRGLVYSNGFDWQRKWHRVIDNASRAAEQAPVALHILSVQMGLSQLLTTEDLHTVNQTWLGPERLANGWETGQFSRLADLLIRTGAQRFDLQGENVDWLKDGQIDQWLPADFLVDAANRTAFATFCCAVMLDKHSYTSTQLSNAFAFCVGHMADSFDEIGAPVTCVALEDLVRLLDSPDPGQQMKNALSGTVLDNHRLACGRDPLDGWYSTTSLDPYRFILEEDLTINGFVFHMPQNAREYAFAHDYCGLKKRARVPMAGRIPAVIVSHVSSPKVPLGMVKPWSDSFELSQQFYDQSGMTKRQANKAFRSIASRYWDLFEKKYPYEW